MHERVSERPGGAVQDELRFCASSNCLYACYRSARKVTRSLVVQQAQTTQDLIQRQKPYLEYRIFDITWLRTRRDDRVDRLMYTTQSEQ
jgi:hypothetical protein